MVSTYNLQLFNSVLLGNRFFLYLTGPYFPLNGYEKTHYVVQRPVDDGFDRAFHVYGIEWTSEGLIYTVDGAVTGTVVPPEGGFWELGEFPSDVTNPWTGGEKMAPFDQEVHACLHSLNFNDFEII